MPVGFGSECDEVAAGEFERDDADEIPAPRGVCNAAPNDRAPDEPRPLFDYFTARVLQGRSVIDSIQRERATIDEGFSDVIGFGSPRAILSAHIDLHPLHVGMDDHVRDERCHGTVRSSLFNKVVRSGTSRENFSDDARPFDDRRIARHSFAYDAGIRIIERVGGDADFDIGTKGTTRRPKEAVECPTHVKRDGIVIDGSAGKRHHKTPMQLEFSVLSGFPAQKLALPQLRNNRLFHRMLRKRFCHSGNISRNATA